MRRRQSFGRERRFAVDVDVHRFRLDRAGGDEDAFDEQVRVAFDQMPVLEHARLALLRVDDEIARTRVRPGAVPLRRHGEVRAAAPEQARLFDQAHDRRRLHRTRGAQACVRSPGQRVVDARRIDAAATCEQASHFPIAGRARRALARRSCVRRCDGGEHRLARAAIDVVALYRHHGRVRAAEAAGMLVDAPSVRQRRRQRRRKIARPGEHAA